MLDVRVHLNLGPIVALTRPIPRKVFRQWAARYRSFVQLRFDKYSKGGGSWPPLKPATIARRRKPARGTKKGAARVVSILRDTGLLFNALSPRLASAPGALQEDLSDGILVGYGGAHRHSTGGKATIADIASFHQKGGGRLPARPIIVSPDERTVELMHDDLMRGMGLSK